MSRFGISDSDAVSISEMSTGKGVTSAGRMRGDRGDGESWQLQTDGSYAWAPATPYVFGDYGEPPEIPEELIEEDEDEDEDDYDEEGDEGGGNLSSGAASSAAIFLLVAIVSVVTVVVW
jgi:hypothetical protein